MRTTGARMTNEERRRRRLGADALLVMLCRKCWAPIELLPERVDLTTGRAHYRCQECQELFDIRDDDAERLTLGAGRIEPTAELRGATSYRALRRHVRW